MDPSPPDREVPPHAVPPAGGLPAEVLPDGVATDGIPSDGVPGDELSPDAIPPREVPDLEELYDPATLSLIEARGAGRVRPPGRRRPVRSAMVAGALLGVGQALELEPDTPAVIEFAPEPADHHDDAIEFVYVHGSPSRSRIIFRPWRCARPTRGRS